MASFAHLFSIRPWETDLLTVGEFEGLCDAVDEYESAHKG